MTGIETVEAAERVENVRCLFATQKELAEIAAGKVVGWAVGQTDSVIDFIVAHREGEEPDNVRLQKVVEAYRGIGVMLHAIQEIPADVAHEFLARCGLQPDD